MLGQFVVEGTAGGIISYTAVDPNEEYHVTIVTKEALRRLL